MQSGKSLKNTVSEADATRLQRAYREARTAFHIDDRLQTLWRAGRSGFIPTLKEHAVHAAVAASHLGDGDWFVGSPKEAAGALLRGHSSERIFAQALGRGLEAAGLAFGYCDRSKGLLSSSSLSSPHLTHATGIAWSMRLNSTALAGDLVGQKNVVVVFGSDSSADAGDFHSAANFAGVCKAPIVFVILSHPDRRPPSPMESVADKAQAYGVLSHRVDANDVLGFDELIGSCLRNARTQKDFVPTILEVVFDPASREESLLESFGRSISSESDEIARRTADFAMRREILAELESGFVRASQRPETTAHELQQVVFTQ